MCTLRTFALSILFVLFFCSLHAGQPEEAIILPEARVFGDSDGLRISGTADWEVVGRDALAATGKATLAEALASGVAGVRVERSGGREKGAQISIRGMGGQRVLILIDGQPAAGTAGELPVIPVSEIARVEILRGAASARYGDRALGGALNIITKKDDPAALILNLGYASFATLRASALAPLNFGQTRLTLGASAEKSDGGWLYPGQFREYPDGTTTLDGDRVSALNTGYSTYRGALHGAHSFTGETRVTLDAEYAAREAGVPGTINFPTARAAMRDQVFRLAAGAKTSPASRGDTLSLSGVLSRQRRAYRDDTESLNALAQNTLAINYSLPLAGAQRERPARHLAECPLGNGAVFARGDEAGARRAVFARDNEAQRAEAGAAADQDSETNDDAPGILAPGEREARGSALLRFGVEAQYLSLETAGIGVGFGDPTRAVFSLYTDDEFTVSDFIFSAALRGDLHGGYGAFLSPALGCAWNFHKDWRIALNAGTAYRVPSFEELFWPMSAFAVGNPNLRPERALSVDCGLIWQAASALQLRVSAFVQRYDSLILWQPSAGGVWRPTNIARVLARGVEAAFSGDAMLSASFTLGYRAEYSLNISEDRDLGKQVPRVPKEKASAHISIQWLRHASISLIGSYTGFRYVNRANTKFLDEYFLLDSSIDITITEWAKIKFAVHNIFNKVYVHLREYPVPGREILTTLEVRL
ncbi:MAG: TonB-dependent receptor [Spirochaetota bacterium]|nr:TonB-dependent receptor [Spirochaetota bacterium]